MNKITSFISAYWKHPVALFIYAAIAIYIIYRVGQSKGTFKGNKLPKETDWGAALTEVQSENIRRISQRLFRDMDSYYVSVGLKDRDVEVYKQLLALDGNEFKGVYNDFGDLYFNKNKGTLYKWIYDESFTYTLGASGDLRETILEKMEKLNLG